MNWEALSVYYLYCGVGMFIWDLLGASGRKIIIEFKEVDGVVEFSFLLGIVLVFAFATIMLWPVLFALSLQAVLDARREKKKGGLR